MSNSLYAHVTNWLRHTSVVFWIFALVTMALYASSLNDAAVFDDALFKILQESPAWHFSLAPRALTEATIVGTTHWVGMDLFWQRVENLVFHIFTVTMVFVFTREILSWLKQQEEADGEVLICSLLASLIFLAHPVTVYGVAYLNQRSTELASFFSLLTLLVFWRGLHRDSKALLWAAVPCYLLTLLSKEHAIMVPGLCFALAVVHDGGLRKTRFLQLLPLALAFAAVMYGVVFKANHRDIVGQSPEHSANYLVDNYVHFYPGFAPDKALWYSALTQGTLFFKYWQLWLLPNPLQMAIDIRTRFATTLWSGFTVGTALYVVYGLLAVIVLFRGKTRVQRFIGFSLLAPWLLFWTEFASLRLQEIFVLYRSYLWFIFLVPALALFFSSLHPRVRYGLFGVLLLVCVILSIERIHTLRNEITAWRDSLEVVRGDPDKRPGVERIYYNLGTAYLNAKRYPEAITTLQAALDYVPTAYTRKHTMLNLAISYELSGQYDNAVPIYLELVRLEPESVGYWLSAGNILVKTGHPKEAVGYYRHACEQMQNQDGCTRLEATLNGADTGSAEAGSTGDATTN